MNNFDSITYIAGVARSGTSWLGQIFDSSPQVCYRFQPFFSYEFKNRVNEDSSEDEFIQLLMDMYNTKSPFLTQDDLRKSGAYPSFMKNEVTPYLVLKENRYQYIIEPLMRKCPEIRLVGIVRNPNAVLNSWMKNIKEFPEGSDPMKEWRFGDCKNRGHGDFFGYYKWKEVANLYLDLYDKWPNRVYLLRYEDLVISNKDRIQDLFQFCSIEYHNQTDDFIDKSSSKHDDSPYSVYKDKRVLDQWKNELPNYILKEITADISGTRLEQFL